MSRPYNQREVEHSRRAFRIPYLYHGALMMNAFPKSIRSSLSKTAVVGLLFGTTSLVATHQAVSAQPIPFPQQGFADQENPPVSKASKLGKASTTDGIRAEGALDLTRQLASSTLAVSARSTTPAATSLLVRVGDVDMPSQTTKLTSRGSLTKSQSMQAAVPNQVSFMSSSEQGRGSARSSTPSGIQFLTK